MISIFGRVDLELFSLEDNYYLKIMIDIFLTRKNVKEKSNLEFKLIHISSCIHKLMNLIKSY